MNRIHMHPVASLARARRICAIGTALAVIATLALLTLAVLAALDVVAPFPRTLRIALAGCGALALLATILSRWLESRRRHTDLAAARAMESAHPEFGQQFRTALEVARRGVPENAEPETKFFATQLIIQAEKSLTRFSWSRLVPRGRWMLWMLAGVAVAAAVAFGALRSPDFRLALSRLLTPASAGTYTRLTWTVAPNVFDDRHPPRFELRVERRLAEPTLYVRMRGGEWVKTPMTALPDGRSWDIVLTGRTSDLEIYAIAGDARTDTHAVSFEPIPKLTATRVQIAYPEYTGLKSELRKQGDVTVVEDTKVRWDFTFNVAPKAVEWRMGGDSPQRIAVDVAGKSASAEWLASNGRNNAVLSVLDARGEVIDSWRYVAEGFADALPTVELLEPVKDREATSVTELPVRIRAKDDFGVSEVGLILEAAGQREWVLEKVIPERDQRNVSEIAAAMLEKVPLTMRDNVRLYAYALDHKPRGGPRAVSALRSIDIREFKKRWRFLGGGGGGTPLPPEIRLKVSEGLLQLGELIKAQRVVVSDTFLLRESTRSTGAAVTASAQPIGKRELELSVKAGELLEEWLDMGAIPRDDAALLDTARVQMEEASGSLGLKGPANMDKGFATTDRALTTLLQLRKSLLTLLMKGMPGEGEGQPKPEDKMKSLTDLAREAERLAKEERDVRGQLAPEAAAGTNLEATRRQHEVAVSDGGELYAALVDHPQVNDTAIRLMDAAERELRAADEALHGDQAREKAPPLHASTEQRLLETAKFLRSMDLTEVADTLKKLASQAEQDAKAMQESGDDKKDGAKSEGGGGKGDGKSGSAEEAARQAARDTAMADDILAALSEKAGGAPKPGNAEAAVAQKGVSEELSELREKVAPGKLAQELGKLADEQKNAGNDKADARSKNGKAAGKLEGMGREFRSAAQRLEASRAARLAAAQAMAKELEKQLAAAGEGAGKNPDGKGDGKKPGEKGDGENGDKPGEKGAGKQAGNGSGQGDKPGDKPGEQGMAKGDKPGQGGGGGDKPGQGGKGESDKPGDKPGESGIAKGDQPGKSGPGDKPNDGKQNGRGGISGDLDTVQEGGGGQAMGRFGQVLRGLGDDKLHDFGIKLFNAPFSRESIPLVEEAAKRIDELVAALPSVGAPLASAGRVPEARRREVEDYFRDLSDDFGGEQWEPLPAPGGKADK